MEQHDSMRKAGKESPEGSSEGHGNTWSREHHSCRLHCVARKHAPGGLHRAHMVALGLKGLHTEAGVWVFPEVGAGMPILPEQRQVFR